MTPLPKRRRTQALIKKMRRREVVFDDVDDFNWRRSTVQSSGYQLINLRVIERLHLDDILHFRRAAQTTTRIACMRVGRFLQIAM